MKRPQIYRFIERDYWMSRLAKDSEALSPSDIEAVLDQVDARWHDLTMKFYDDGSVVIIDNDTGHRLFPSQLAGACCDYYVRKRIEQIKTQLHELQLHSA